jgi:hypothetical protein
MWDSNFVATSAASHAERQSGSALRWALQPTIDEVVVTRIPSAESEADFRAGIRLTSRQAWVFSSRHRFAITLDGFRSVLDRVAGTTYFGRTAAGGVGDGVHLAGQGEADVRFSRTCGFLLQLRQDKVISVESDPEIDAEIQRKKVHLLLRQPVLLG